MSPSLKQSLFQHLDRKLMIGYFAFLFCWIVIVYTLLISHGFFSWDYFKYYQCGVMAISPDRFQAYDPDVQMRWYNRIIAPLRVDVMAYNQSVPSWFLLMIPLALVGAAPGFYVWIIGTIAFGLSGLYLVMRELGVPSLKQRLLGLSIACMASYPAFHWFQLGQSTWFLIGFYTFMLYGFLAGRDRLAGVMFALAAIKPQYLLFVLALFLGKKRFRSVAWAAVSGVVLLVLCTFVIGVDNVLFYPKIVFNAETSIKVFGVFQESMICVRGVLSRLLPHSVLMGTLIGVAFAACGLFWGLVCKLLPADASGGSVVEPDLGSIAGSDLGSVGGLDLGSDIAAVGSRRGDAMRRPQAEGTAFEHRQFWSWVIAITILLILIFSPHVHVYDSQLLIISAAVTLGQKLQSRQFKVWTFLLYLYPVFSWAAFLALYIPGADIQNYGMLFLAYHCVLLLLALMILPKQAVPASVG